MIFGVIIGLFLLADCCLGKNVKGKSKVHKLFVRNINKNLFLDLQTDSIIDEESQSQTTDNDTMVRFNSSFPTSAENLTYISESRKAMMKTHILSEEEGRPFIFIHSIFNIVLLNQHWTTKKLKLNRMFDKHLLNKLVYLVIQWDFWSADYHVLVKMVCVVAARECCYQHSERKDA